jgi:hypothetical protein
MARSSRACSASKNDAKLADGAPAPSRAGALRSDAALAEWLILSMNASACPFVQTIIN